MKRRLEMQEYTIRPLRADDRSEVLDFFAEMGEESVSFFNSERGNEKRTLLYLRRFNSNKRLS